MWPGAVADALARFEWAFRQPGRYLNAPSPDWRWSMPAMIWKRPCFTSRAVPGPISAG